MKIFAVICTRDKNLSSVTHELLHTLSSYGVEVKLLVNQKSIFGAYSKGLNSCKASATDIIIFCHDDIKILSPKLEFLAALSKCVEQETGIVGAAGTTNLGTDAIWWFKERWEQGFHRGKVKHILKNRVEVTPYGDPGQVVALDGLFLAARKQIWEEVGLDKPEYFEGLWDFYDIHYTTSVHNLGYKNYAIPLDILHLSGGDLVGRDSWHKNREAFIAQTTLPLKLQ